MAPTTSGPTSGDSNASDARAAEAVINDYVGATDSVATTNEGPGPRLAAGDVSESLPKLRLDGGLLTTTTNTTAGLSDAGSKADGEVDGDDDDEGSSDESRDMVGELEHAGPIREQSSFRLERLSSLDPSNLETLLSGGLDRFYGKCKHAWKQHNLSFPTPEVHFENLSYTVWLSNESSLDKSSIGGFLRGVVAPWRKLRTVKKVILHPMSGMIQPGTLTLILANPGAGKSSFLKALAGKLKSSKGYRSVKGTVSFSGLLAEEIDVSKLVGLVDQLDNHVPTLTVRETINFADRCLNGPPELQPPKLREVARLRTDLCLHILGLTKCADTCVGDALLRGVSGGERKRVTIGEMLVGGQSVFLCDEISTGLDSAAVFDIVKSLRSWTRTLGGSAVVALLQPPPEVVEMFDDIMILSEGRLVYHGARTEMLPYFSQLGFACPLNHVEPAEFVVDVVSGRGKQFLSHTTIGKPPRTPAQFEECFRNSGIFKRAMVTMEDKHRHTREIKNETEMQSVAHLIRANSKTSAYKNSFYASTALLLERQRKIWMRDRALGVSKMIEAMSDGIILGIIYLNVSTKLYLRMLFFLVAIFQRQGWQQVTISFQMRHVFYKQRSRNFFRTLNFTLAESLIQVPINLAVSLVLVIIFYFMSGLARDASSFFKLYAVIASFQHCINAYFGMLSSLSPSITAAQSLVSLSVSFFLLFSGNIILPKLIPEYWMWMHWYNPVAWALRALLINEFHAPRYTDAERVQFLDTFQVTKGPEYIWIAIIVLFCYYIIFTLLNTLVLRYVHYEATATGGVSLDQGNSNETTLDLMAPTTKAKQSDELAGSQHVVVAVPSGSNDNDTTHSNSTICVPAYLAVRNLDYFVPNPANPSEELQLLHGVTAHFAPGTMTALMGSSGAGKTTFMDVLAGRKTGGRIVGDIMVNGEPKDPTTFSRIAGYCEQMDIHSGGATIREALEFSATLRLPSTTSPEEHREIVEGAMDLLELRPLEKELVRNCSVEQKKRITIGVEMVANPSLLFLDEPTSGLDARAASIVMKGVLSIARTGRTVICTIHQPSKKIFELFDNLLLLQKGGYTAFFGELGEDSCKLLEYFAGIPGTSAMLPNYNPATYMLEVIGAGIGRGVARDYSVEYGKSALFDSNNIATDRMAKGGVWNSSESAGSNETAMVPFSTQHLAPIATGFRNQFVCCVKKMTLTYWRNPQYNLVRMVGFPVYAVIFGSTFYKLKANTVPKISSHVGLMYNTLDFIGVINLMTVLDTATSERAVFYRERMSNYYDPLPYSLSLFVAELPYMLFNSFVFVNIEYWMVGWSADAWSFFLFWFVFCLHVSLATTIGQFMAVLMPNIKVANVSVGTISVFFNLFSGFLMPHKQMRSFYSWIRYLVVTNYSLESLVSIQFGKCEMDANGMPRSDMQGCTVLPGTVPPGGLTLKEFIAQTYDFRVSELGVNIAVLVGYWVALQIAIYLTLRFVSHLKR